MAITELSREVRVLLVRGDGAAPEREREWEGLAGGLAREGLRVLTAAGADAALRRYRAEAPAAVVLDAGADAGGDGGGGLDALALCRAGRERAGPGGAAVVVLGRRIDDAPVAAAYAAGADAHVALPCAPRVLALRLRALVGSGAPGSHGSPGAPSPRPDPVLRLGGWEL